MLAWSLRLAPKVAPLTGTLGAIGFAVLLLVLVGGLEDLLGSAVFLLAGCYVLGLFAGRHPLDERAPLVAAALLACAELATWSLERRHHVPVGRQLVLARLGALCTLVLAGLAASALVVLPAMSYVLWLAAPMVARSVVALEGFPETFNPGYFLLKLALLVLAAAALLQALLDVIRPPRQPVT